MTDPLDPYAHALRIGHQLRQGADASGMHNATAMVDQQAAVIRDYFAGHGIDLTDRAVATAVLVTALYCHDSAATELSNHQPCFHGLTALGAINFAIATLTVVLDPAGEHAP